MSRTIPYRDMMHRLALMQARIPKAMALLADAAEIHQNPNEPMLEEKIRGQAVSPEDRLAVADMMATDAELRMAELVEHARKLGTLLPKAPPKKPTLAG